MIYTYHRYLKNYMYWYINEGVVEAITDGFDLYTKCCQKFRRTFSQALEDTKDMVIKCIGYNCQVLSY